MGAACYCNRKLLSSYRMSHFHGTSLAPSFFKPSKAPIMFLLFQLWTLDRVFIFFSLNPPNFTKKHPEICQETLPPWHRPSGPLAQYLQATARTKPGHYPGSAALAVSWLRPQDRAMWLGDLELCQVMGLAMASPNHPRYSKISKSRLTMNDYLNIESQGVKDVNMDPHIFEETSMCILYHDMTRLHVDLSLNCFRRVLVVFPHIYTHRQNSRHRHWRTRNAPRSGKGNSSWCLLHHVGIEKTRLFEISRDMSTALAQNIAGLSGASVQVACSDVFLRFGTPTWSSQNRYFNLYILYIIIIIIYIYIFIILGSHGISRGVNDLSWLFENGAYHQLAP